MSNSYFIDTSSDFKAHAGEGWRVFGPSKTTEELRKSIDILSEKSIRERKLNTELRSRIDTVSEQLTLFKARKLIFF